MSIASCAPSSPLGPLWIANVFANERIKMTFTDLVSVLPKATPSAVLLALIMFGIGSIVSSLNANSWMKGISDEENLIKQLTGPDNADARDLLSKDIFRRIKLHTGLSRATSQLLKAASVFRTTFACLSVFAFVGFVQLIWFAFSGGPDSLDWNLIFAVSTMLLGVLAFCAAVDILLNMLSPLIDKFVGWIQRRHS